MTLNAFVRTGTAAAAGAVATVLLVVKGWLGRGARGARLVVRREHPDLRGDTIGGICYTRFSESIPDIEPKDHNLDNLRRSSIA